MNNRLMETEGGWLAEQDRFTPGAKNGVPVPVAIALKVTLRGCWWESQNPDGTKAYVLGLSDQPRQEMLPPVDPPSTAVLTSGNGMSDPEPVEQVDSPAKPLFDRKTALPVLPLHKSGAGRGTVYEVHFDVDRQGIPENVTLTKCPNKADGEILLAAVRRLRFKPAFRGGRPVVTHDVIQVAVQMPF